MRTASKSEKVETVFDHTEKYLGRREFDIRIRLETVLDFTKDRRYDQVLDIGCGNGALSLPLLSNCRKLTMLDLSRNMLELARKNLSPQHSGEVEMVQGDFMDAEFDPESFNLILCIGVLAHVDSPSAVIEKIARIAKPGSCVILEMTDNFHFWGWHVVAYQNLLKLVRPEPYPLNCLKRRWVLEMLKENGLVVQDQYRYGIPPPGTSLFLGQDKMYRATRYLFGSTEGNRNRRMGNEYIYLLRKA